MASEPVPSIRALAPTAASDAPALVPSHAPATSRVSQPSDGFASIRRGVLEEAPKLTRLPEGAKVAATAPSAVKVAPNFGAKNGTPIVNQKTILQDLYRSLGHDKPPAVAFIFVEPLSSIKLSNDSGSGSNPFGHAAVAYTLPSGETVTMNIRGKIGAEMVNFVPLDEYLFGVSRFDAGSSQGGAYNRKMEMVLIWDWPQEKIVAMDRYFRSLDERAEAKDAKFFLAPSYFRNALGKILPGEQKEYGNCARWTSKGLVEAGLRSSPSYWPKDIAVDFMRDFAKADVVTVERVHHAVQTFGKDVDMNGPVAPISFYRNWRYHDLSSFASRAVVVPEGTMRAQVERTGSTKR